MSDLPIIFSGPMVRAMLEGRKSMTRRLAWREPHMGKIDFSSEELESFDVQGWNAERRVGLYYISKPSPWQRMKPGDRLWVRESIRRDTEGWHYSTEYPDRQRQIIQLDLGHPSVAAMIAWAHHKEGDSAPSIHMPRWASRLTLIVTATKIERLHEISEADAVAEGVQHRWLKSAACAPRSHYFVDAGDRIEHSGHSAKSAFEMLWLHLHGPASWVDNPEVVAITFTVHQTNIDAMPKTKAA